MTTTSPKVIGATGGSIGGGALSVVILYLLGTYAHFNPPPEVAAAVTLIISAVTAYVGGWLSPHLPAPPQGG